MILLTAIQDHQLTFTGADFAWIVTLILAIGNLIALAITLGGKARSKLNEPEKIQNDRINTLTERLAKLQDDVKSQDIAVNDRFEKMIDKYDDLIYHYQLTRDRHDKEIADLSEGQVILARAVKNITDHFLHDNNKEGMKQSVSELEDYIYKQAKKKRESE